MELKAELAKKEQEYKDIKAKNELKRSLSAKGSDKNEKVIKRTKSNTSGATSKSYEEDAWEKSRKCLEEKARLYEKLQRGDYEGIDNSFRDNLLVDFERQELLSFHEGGGTVVEQEYVDYEDEFGRTRKMPKAEWEALELERQRHLADEFIEQLRPRTTDKTSVESMASSAAPVHYDDSIEVARAKGVGFFRFSQEEESRDQQMSALRSLRQETVDSRTCHMITGEQRELEKELRLQRIAERRARLLESSKPSDQT